MPRTAVIIALTLELVLKGMGRGMGGGPWCTVKLAGPDGPIFAFCMLPSLLSNAINDNPPFFPVPVVNHWHPVGWSWHLNAHGCCICSVGLMATIPGRHATGGRNAFL